MQKPCHFELLNIFNGLIYGCARCLRVAPLAAAAKTFSGTVREIFSIRAPRCP